MGAPSCARLYGSRGADAVGDRQRGAPRHVADARGDARPGLGGRRARRPASGLRADRAGAGRRAPVRLAREPVDPAGHALGRRPLRRDRRPRLRRAAARRVLPAVPAARARGRRAARLAAARRAARRAGRLRRRAVPPAPPRRARGRRALCRAGPARRRALPHGVLLLGALHGVAVPRAQRRRVLRGAAAALGDRGAVRRAGRGDAQHRRAAARRARAAAVRAPP